MVAFPGPVRTTDTAFTTGIAASIGACYFAIDTAAICNTTVASASASAIGYAVDTPCAYGFRLLSQHPSRTADVRPFSFSFI
jgi:hypothetical protein